MSLLMLAFSLGELTRFDTANLAIEILDITYSGIPAERHTATPLVYSSLFTLKIPFSSSQSFKILKSLALISAVQLIRLSLSGHSHNLRRPLYKYVAPSSYNLILFDLI